MSLYDQVRESQESTVKVYRPWSERPIIVFSNRYYHPHAFTEPVIRFHGGLTWPTCLILQPNRKRQSQGLHEPLLGVFRDGLTMNIHGRGSRGQKNQRFMVLDKKGVYPVVKLKASLFVIKPLWDWKIQKEPGDHWLGSLVARTLSKPYFSDEELFHKRTLHSCKAKYLSHFLSDQSNFR